ncbi:rCG53590 [Rattus norvegicus]|uniref:RCG53590 n=1 Tax=Rattus norvegicus TaxID=10116 RepID=A6J8M7_RAT|nr:rCG53590 [Rattus norvegicus]
MTHRPRSGALCWARVAVPSPRHFAHKMTRRCAGGPRKPGTSLTWM